MTKSPKSLSWYLRRLQAMGPSELALRVRSAWLKRSESAALARLTTRQPITEERLFPVLPEPTAIAGTIRDTLAAEAAKVAAGHWTILHGHEVSLPVPPDWQRDYLNGGVGDAALPSRSINYRAQGETLDPRVVWELSRWTQLVRLSQAAYLQLLAESDAVVLDCLENWVAQNPTGFGLNWTSPMEPGLRLMNFVWIHALLSQSNLTQTASERLARLVDQIVPTHVWWVWRYHSFGSSANNHLLGELAGLILAQARWPQCAQWSTPLADLSHQLQREIVRQFASDGGNRETSLHYHLFAFELCWQAIKALQSQGLEVSAEVLAIMGKAGQFFANMIQPTASWDYGDSDDAHVTPFYTSEKASLAEWQQWLQGEEGSFSYWLGFAPAAPHPQTSDLWQIYPQSGYASGQQADWKVRLDASPLGFGSIAAHGQLDALHVSLWQNGWAVLIDPGTGSYFGKPALREHFVSAAAHNGPHFDHAALYPARHGAFLWGAPHAVPELSVQADVAKASLPLADGFKITRTLALKENELLITDELNAKRPTPFAIHWQFAPEISFEATPDGLVGHGPGGDFRFDVSASIELATDLIQAGEEALLGLCSPYYGKYLHSAVVRVQGTCDGTVTVATTLQKF